MRSAPRAGEGGGRPHSGAGWRLAGGLNKGLGQEVCAMETGRSTLVTSVHSSYLISSSGCAPDKSDIFRVREANIQRTAHGMADLRQIITCYVDFRLGGSGYPELKICKDHSPADRDIFEGVSEMCAQLESDLRFSNTLEYFRKFGVIGDAFQVVLDKLLIGELNWARVLSIVALSGSLAVQCAERGEEKIRDCAASFAEVKLAPWIEANHGMEGLRQYFHLRGRDVSAAGACAVVGVIIVGLFASERAGG